MTLPRRRDSRGFTLLEVLVASVIMAVAVTGVLANLRTSLSNAARLSERDRAAILARRQMDTLVASRTLAKGMPFGGAWPAELTGGMPAGWQAVVAPFETNTLAGAALAPGQRFVERIELTVWWGPPESRRSLQLETFRTAVATPADAQVAQLANRTPVLRPIR
jgi:general secretion pathway protein I